MDKKNYDMDDEIRTPSGNEYNPSTATSIRRRYGFTIKNKQLTAETQYTIDGKRYKVNSVFDLLSTQYCDEGLKRLMAEEANKVS